MPRTTGFGSIRSGSWSRVLSVAVGAVVAAAVVTGPTSAAPIPATSIPTASIIAGAMANQSGGLAVSGLSTNHLDKPLGTTTAAPTFGWQLEGPARGIVQRSYRLQVATTEQALRAGRPDVWDSGTVASDDSVAVGYAGPALQPATRYFWRIRAVDNHGADSGWSAPTWWETALPAGDDWAASWISSPPPQIPGIDWTDYTATFVTSDISNGLGILLHSDSAAANTYMWQLSNAGGTERLRPHLRVNGGWQLLGEVPIPAAELPGGFAARHTVAISVVGPTVITSIDGTVVDTRAVGAPIAAGTIGFRTCDCEDESGQVHEVTVTAGGDTLLHTDFADSANPFGVGTVSAPGTLTLGHQGNEAIGLLTPKTGLPLLRKDFDVAKKRVSQARLYATALGLYRAEINGRRVGDQELAPGWTDYDTRVQYQTYDVTDLLKTGPATIGVQLAPGWYAGQIASFGTEKYGHWPAFRGKLVIEYADGSIDTVVSGPDWSWHDGPFRAADLINGETYDARYQVPGWSTPGTRDASWQPVATVAGVPAGYVQPQTDQPARVTGTLPTRKVTTPAKGVSIYDVGQNMVGRIKVSLTGTAGSTVRLRYGEMLNPDGTLYTANLRSAKVTDYYTFAATGTVSYEPSFTSHGFRYVEVTGTTTAPTAQQLTGIVVTTDTPLTSRFETSDPMLNQLQSNIVWGQRDNFLSVPTDTPARDERLGWTGDIDMFSPTASFNADTYAFLSKWLTDLRDAQLPDGSVTAVAPDPTHCCGVGGPGWSDALVGVTYTLWQHFGDPAVVAANYAAMVKFADYLAATSSGDLRTQQTFGDWLNLDDPTPAGVIATAFYARSIGQLAELADATGHSADAAKYTALAARIKSAFAAAYVGPDGTVAGNSQAGYAIALGMGLVPDELTAAAGEHLVAAVAARGYHLSTGFLGTPFLLPALSATGHLDVAYRLMMTKDYPSWLYEVDQGATTMWERWDSLKPDGTFGDVSMNSFNHYAYGAVGEWMYATIGGITASSAGYRSATIAPQLGGSLTSASVSHDSPYGTVSSDWKSSSGALTMTVTVPANTTATVLIPAAGTAAVTEGHHPITGRSDLTVGAVADGIVKVRVGSGRYRFQVDTSVALTELAAPQDIRPGQTVQVTATLSNPDRRPATVSVRLAGPAGWQPGGPVEVTVRARSSMRVLVPITAPVTVAAGEVPLTATLTDADSGRLDTGSTRAAVTIPEPAGALDTVSFGVAGSETAHQVSASPSSGTSEEAGVMRRYSHNGYPGSWFEATMAVTPGRPFVITMLETFSGDGSAATKDYDVLVDGTVAQHFVLTRFGTEPGTLMHQVLVPAELAPAGGKVQIRFRYNASGRGFDPSLSKVWTAEAP